MPASSKAQQRFFGVVKSMQKGDKPKKGEAGKIAKQMSKKDVDKYASTKHKGKPEKVKREMKVRELIKKMVREELAGLDEAAKRDYKAEYKKFQSSDKSKKYRAELNKYNRQKGTYGNGDGKDASHKGGKIVGFEKESVNRGRAEKSRLKKEEKLTEVDFGKIKLPSQVNRFLDKFVQSMKGANLNRMKRASILYKVIDAAGMTPQQLMADIQKIKTAMKEEKLTEDFKNNKWEVYVADEKGKEKMMKVAKSKRAGVILYNKLINTDKFHEVGMRVIKEGKLTEDKFIAFYKKDRVTVNAKSLWDAKKQIIAKLKVPKKDVGLVSVLNKTEYDKQKFRFEQIETEGNDPAESGEKVE